jgi:hypothetical protein
MVEIFVSDHHQFVGLPWLICGLADAHLVMAREHISTTRVATATSNAPFVIGYDFPA